MTVSANTTATELEADTLNISDSRLPQPVTRPRLPLPHTGPTYVLTRSHSASNQSASPTNNNKRPAAPVIFTIPCDNEQEQDNDQVELQDSLRRKDHHDPSSVIAQRRALLPKLDLRRTQSAAEALNLMRSDGTTNKDAQFTSSTEYPYVLHTFEVVGKDKVYIGSLPNMLQFTQRDTSQISLASDAHYKHSLENGKRENQDVYPPASVEAGESNSIDDECYADGGHVVQNFLESSSTGGNQNTELTYPDYRYEEYPSSWANHTAHQALEFGSPTSGAYDCLSPPYQNIDEYQKYYDKISHPKDRSGSAVLPSDRVSSLKSYISKQNSAPIQKTIIAKKPPVLPRTKLAHLLSASEQVTEPADVPGDSSIVSPEMPHSSKHYMKLIHSTKDDVHGYSYLLHDRAESSEFTVHIESQ